MQTGIKIVGPSPGCTQEGRKGHGLRGEEGGRKGIGEGEGEGERKSPCHCGPYHRGVTVSREHL